MRSSLLLIVLSIVVGIFSCTGAELRIIEVSPSGPLSSMSQARDAVRKLRGEGYSGAVAVRIADGTYPLSEPVIFDPQDSGPVTYEAAPNTHPIFTGGKQITGWKAAPGGLWTTKVDPKWRFEALWINGRRAIRARTPNVDANDLPKDFIHATSQPTQPLPGLPLSVDVLGAVISVPPSDAAPLAKLTPEELHEAQMVSFHSWDAVRHRLAGVREADATIQTTGSRGFPFFKPDGPHPQRLYFENFRSALDAPGEWFLAIDGTLTYKPRPGESLSSIDARAGVTERWLVFQGDPKAGKYVTGLQFRALSFAHQSYTLPNDGEYNGQAQAPLAAAIEADGAQNIVFENCAFEHTMNSALWFRRGCSEIRVTHCLLSDLGGGGIKIGHYETKDDGPEQTHHVTVEDTIIHTGGRYFLSAVGVLVFHAHHCTIRHCDIADFFYSAISIGWTWGYAVTAAGHNLVEDCHLHHIGWGLLSDMGAVYTLGVQPGTVIRGCRIHDISVAEYGGWGMYNDEGSTGFVWENNLVYRCHSNSYHLHYGKDNTLRNNILAFARESQIRRSRPEDHFAVDIRNNIVIFDRGELFGPAANWKDGHFSADRNVYWMPGGKSFDFAGMSFHDWQAVGYDRDSVIADPAFVDAAKGDFRLKPNSPALKLGFVPFDASKAGVTGDTAWQKLAAEPFPETVFGITDLDPAPLNATYDYTHLPNEARPVGMTSFDGGLPGAIKIADGGIRITDGPQAQPDWNPHFFYRPHHTEGLSRITFEFTPDPKTHLLVEGRDSADPYHTGPSLDFNQGILYVGGKDILHYPPDKPLTVSIETNLGKSDTFDLTITPEGGSPKKLPGLKLADPAFKQLQWFGFINPSRDNASWKLKKIEFRNKTPIGNTNRGNGSDRLH
jgi:hypothetical protein